MKLFFKIAILIILVLVFIFLFFYSSDIILSPASIKNFEKKACFGSNCFLVELVKTSKDRGRGLMFRQELGRDKGMLFVFEEQGIYPFWMKNTLIPLDIIWINKNKKIVFLSRGAQPCEQDPCPVITPDTEASYVLEINAGISDDIGLKPGDTAVLDY